MTIVMIIVTAAYFLTIGLYAYVVVKRGRQYSKREAQEIERAFKEYGELRK